MEQTFDLKILLTSELWAFALIFARTGAVLMVMPVFGETYVLIRHRLLLALGVAALLVTIIGEQTPPWPSSYGLMAAQLLQEIILGLLIGTCARLIMAALHVGGETIAMSSGMAAASFFDPNQGAAGSDFGRILTMTLLTMLVLTDGHLWALGMIAEAYVIRPIGAMPSLADGFELISSLSSQAITLGIRIALPILITSFVFNTALGILARLAPTLQVFFIAVPAQIIMAVGLFGLSVGGLMLLAMDFFQTSLLWLEGNR